MKILFVTPYNPANPTYGAALRTFHVLKQLCKLHDVTVVGFSATGGEDQLVKQIPSLKGKVHFYYHNRSVLKEKWNQFIALFTPYSRGRRVMLSSPLQKLIDSILQTQEFDVIQCEFPDMAYHKFNSKALKVLDAHNVEYDNTRRMVKIKNKPLRRLYYQIEWKKMKRDELEMAQKQDAIFTTSERDKLLFDKDIPNVPKFIIPNGVDLSYFSPLDGEPEKHTLVFVGMMTYVPNYDGILYFLDEIFPRILSVLPDAKIYIVGKNPPPVISKRANENIIITGFVDDVRPIIQKASVYVVPLRMGGGTRLKIVEALSMKKPIVTTSIGCEGIDVVNRESVLIADDAQQFADSVIELCRDRELANQLTQNGYELVYQKYGWESVGYKLDAAYSKLNDLHTTDYEALSESGIGEQSHVVEKLKT